MKYALGLIVLITAMGFAQGCSDDSFSIGGYAKAWLYNFGQDGPTNNTFRAYDYTTLTGKLNDNTFARIAFDYKSWTGNSSFGICDAYLSMKIMPELGITAGQFKIPFGWAYNCSGGGLYFLDRAAVTIHPDFANYGGRDTGINLHGQFDFVGVDLGYFNGTGLYTDSDTLQNKEMVGKISVMPTHWLTVAGGVAMIGQPEDTTSGSDWSATALNAYALADYPLSDNSKLIFEGEYYSLPYAGPDMANADENAGTDFYATLGVKFDLQNSFLTGVLPAIRYESIDPHEVVATGATGSDDGVTVMDACLNCFMATNNTVQIGIRNVGYEDSNEDGYTDVYLGWRLNY